MIAYEFSTQLIENRQVTIPTIYANAIPAGSTVRIILLVDETSPQ